jgi:hypothetical protein
MNATMTPGAEGNPPVTTACVCPGEGTTAAIACGKRTIAVSSQTAI